MVKGDRDIPVASNLNPPSGCPRRSIKSIEECSNPTNSSVCLEFCPKTNKPKAKEVIVAREGPHIEPGIGFVE